MIDRQLIEICVEQLQDGQTFPKSIGEFKVLAVPRIGEFLHLDDADESLLGRVIRIRNFAEHKSPEDSDVHYVGGANILVTVETASDA